MLPTPTIDFHCHSQFSPDGRDSMAAMCEQAVQNGLTAVAFTEHAEWHSRWSTLPALSDYFAEIDRCRTAFAPSGLAIYSGIELGNPHEYQQQVANLLEQNQFDVVIASLHWLEGENIQMDACFRGHRADDVYADYFTALGEMAATGDATIIGHFDRILWRGALLGTPLKPRRLESIIRESLATIAWRQTALELNTRFLRSEPNWREDLVLMLKWYREEGGHKVIINSDAHSTWYLGANIHIAQQLLSQAGLEPIMSLTELVSVRREEIAR